MTGILETINESIMATTDDAMQIITLAAQGPEGSPYPTLQGNFYYNVPTVSEKPLISYSVYAFEINELYGLKTASGTCTISIIIDGVAITGLDEIEVTTTSQDVTATALNSVSVASRVTISITEVSSASGLEFSAKGTLS